MFGLIMLAIVMLIFSKFCFWMQEREDRAEELKEEERLEYKRQARNAARRAAYKAK